MEGYGGWWWEGEVAMEENGEMEKKRGVMSPSFFVPLLLLLFFFLKKERERERERPVCNSVLSIVLTRPAEW